MITINLTTDKRRIKKNNTYPIVFRIAYNGQNRLIPTSFSTLEKDWNKRQSYIKETHPLYDLVAPKLKELEIQYLEKCMAFEKLYPHNTDIQKLKDFVTEKESKSDAKNNIVTVYDFWKQEIQLLNTSNKNGNSLVYQFSLNAINKVKNLNIPFENIDYNFLRGLEASFINNGLKTNTISLYFRTLRAIYNKAIKSKVTSKQNYPFDEFKIKKAPTTPRPISLEETSKYFQLQLDTCSKLYDSWLIGKLIFMLIGINYKDIIMLTEVNLNDNRLIYTRAKTHKIYSIKLLNEAIEIINYFKQKGGNTLLAVITANDMLNKTKFTLLVKQRNKVFNAHLNKIGKLIDCKEPLTSYVFRYTWANIAKQLGYSKDLIAEALGHEYGNKVTGIYLEAYDKRLIDEMNERIYREVLNIKNQKSL